MRRTILLISAIFLLLGCSSKDDTVEEQQEITELKIKKFTTTEVHNQNIRIEYYFDEDSKPTKRINTIDGIDMLRHDISYNDLGQVTVAEGISVYQGQISPWERFEYEYNASNDLVGIDFYMEGNFLAGEFMAIHHQDSIQVHKDVGDDGVSDTSFIFGADNLLKKSVVRTWAAPIIQEYTYIDDNLVNYNQNGQEDNFEYDNKINPLYSLLMRDYKNNVIDNLGFYRILTHNNKYLYSKNNRVFKQGPNQTAYITTYVYNDLGYPVSAEVTINGQLFELLTYEYY